MAIYLSKFEVEQEFAYHEKIKDRDTLSQYINKICEKYKSIKEVCAIVHDKDKNDNGTDKAPHFHIYVKMGTNQELNWIAKLFEVPPQFINRIEGKWQDALAYATHKNRPNKWQYDYEELILYNMTIEQYSNKVQQSHLDEIAIKQALFDYGNCKMSKRQLLTEHLNTAEMYAKYTGLFKQMQDYRKLKVKSRNMKVIYICGGSGSGKTTLAKYLSNIQGLDYFVSGSGADPLDSYDKEECIILDDLRDDTFTKAELFKLTDNNTDSSVKSRFQNKNISNCKLMIITSIKPPYTLYNWQEGNEPFEQFARRLGYEYLHILDDGTVMERRYWSKNWQDLDSKQAPFSMEMVFAVLGIKKEIGSDFMDSLFSQVREHIKNGK